MSVTQASLLGDTFGSKASGTIPVGGIIMWSGSIGTIPTGWALCNGSNGTPNLQDRFIVGAGSGYSVAGTGGSADATLVSHNHSGSAVAVGNHAHGGAAQIGPVRTLGGQTSEGNIRYVNLNSGNTGDAGSHSHTLSINAEGSSATNANLPPYYALAFIMRVL